MQTSQPSLFTRPDTFFGVCEALGEDLGFNANLLRVTLGVLLLWNPAVVLGTYVALGVVVAVSRWLYPKPRAAAPVEPAEPAPAQSAPETAAETAAPRELALAA